MLSDLFKVKIKMYMFVNSIFSPFHIQNTITIFFITMYPVNFLTLALIIALQHGMTEYLNS